MCFLGKFSNWDLNCHILDVRLMHSNQCINVYPEKCKLGKIPISGFSLEHPQGVGIVGIVGTVGIVGIVGIELCRPKPRPTTPSVLFDI